MVDLYSEKEQRREGIPSYDGLPHPAQCVLVSVKLHILFKIWRPWSRCQCHKWCNLPYINLSITSCLKSLRNTDKCSKLLLYYGCGWILKLLNGMNERWSSLRDVFSTLCLTTSFLVFWKTVCIMYVEQWVTMHIYYLPLR